MARKIKLTEANIRDIVAAHEKGRKVEDICKQFSISPATFYNYRSKVLGPAKNGAERKPNVRTIAKSIAEASMEFEGTTRLPGGLDTERLVTENRNLRKALAALIVSGVANGNIDFDGDAR